MNTGQTKLSCPVAMRDASVFAAEGTIHKVDTGVVDD